MILEETTHGPTADRHRGCDDSPHRSSEEAACSCINHILELNNIPSYQHEINLDGVPSDITTSEISRKGDL